MVELIRMQAYLQQEATLTLKRPDYLVNELFKEYGLVIVDGDDIELKKIIDTLYKERPIFENVGKYQKLVETIDRFESISSEYKIQVNPREINYFYLTDDLKRAYCRKRWRVLFVLTKQILNFTQEALEHRN